MNKKISQLPEQSGLTLNDVIAIVDSGSTTTSKIKLSTVYDGIPTKPSHDYGFQNDPAFFNTSFNDGNLLEFSWSGTNIIITIDNTVDGGRYLLKVTHTAGASNMITLLGNGGQTIYWKGGYMSYTPTVGGTDILFMDVYGTDVFVTPLTAYATFP